MFSDKTDKPFWFWSRVIVKVWDEFIEWTVIPSYNIQLDRKTLQGVDRVSMNWDWNKFAITVSAHANWNLSDKN